MGRRGEKRSSAPASDAGEGIAHVLHAAKACIESIGDAPPMNIAQIDAWAKTAGVAVPWPRAPVGGKTVMLAPKGLRLSMACPPSITVVGSFLLGTMAAAADGGSVDVAVELPADAACQAELHKDYVYFCARAYMLARVCVALRDKLHTHAPVLPKDGAEASSDANAPPVLQWRAFRGHSIMPVLVLKPGQGMPDVIFRVTPPRATDFALLRADACNVSPALLGLSETARHPSATHNMLMLSEASMVAHMRAVHAAVRSSPDLRGALRLVRAWVRARGYAACAQHVSAAQLDVIAVQLANSGAFNGVRGELAVFRALCGHVSNRDFTDLGAALLAAKRAGVLASAIAGVKAAQGTQAAPAAALLETTAGANVLFDWSAETAAVLCADALAASTLASAGAVETLFAPNASTPLVLQRDASIMAEGVTWMPAVDANAAWYADCAVPEAARAKLLARKLRAALGSRLRPESGASALSVSAQSPPDWEPTSAPPACISTFVVSLLLDPAESRRLVDRGPLADAPAAEAAAFRALWRGRSSLRRFRDGAVCEAVSWEDSHGYGGRCARVSSDAAAFVLSTHFGASAVRTSDSIDLLASASGASKTAGTASVGSMEDEEDRHTAAIAAFYRLARELRSLPGLPLAVKRVELACPAALRATTGTHTLAHDVLLHLEASPKWPGELYGLRLARRAFLAEIALALPRSTDIATALAEDSFDALVGSDDTAGGAHVFRCAICHEDEARLTRQQGLDPSELVLRNEEAPRHYRALGALAASSGGVLGPAARTLRRWLGTHMYSAHVPPAVSELVVAAALVPGDEASALDVSGAPTAATVHAAFCRALAVLARFPWATRVLTLRVGEKDLLSSSAPSDSGAVWSPEAAQLAFRTDVALQISPAYAADRPHMQPLFLAQCTLTSADVAAIARHAEAFLFAFDARIGKLPIGAKFDGVRFDAVLRVDPALVNLDQKSRSVRRAVADAVDEAAERTSASSATASMLARLPGLNVFAALYKELVAAVADQRLPLRLYADIEGVSLPNIGVVFDAGCTDAEARSSAIQSLRAVLGDAQSS